VETSLYIHIPFCEVKCGYCDFFSVPRGYEDFDLQKEYVDRLIREIGTRAPEFSKRKIRSIFFGGGTPSLLNPPLLEKIFSALSNSFSWDPKIEITLETNPKTVSLEKLKTFRSIGINRLSIGVQSFQDRFLQAMGRIHSGDEAKKTIADARKAGFENVSFDLIYALPGQTFAEWQADLEEAIALGTDHLSAYHLIIEPGTPFAQIYGERARQASPLLPPEEEGVRCLVWTRERLAEAGLAPYEISNFAKPGFESVHNRNYWQYGEYLGFGTAASSFIKNNPEGVRRTNIKNLKKYLEGEWEGFSETISLPTAMGEFCMLGIRTRDGIRTKNFEEEFGKSLRDVYEKPIQRWTEKKWLKATSAGWELTPAGVLFADEVAASFLP
jgi:oxygen-independent coproporphyrinogen-3 oxidase